ncbi:MAG: hypothetical protein IAE63_02660 [Alphaproteobacteria bacterium]|nr:hypothetical protein [Alphaproteobacteria bacterium]
MRPATQEEVVLFTMMGQALLNIQILEECLSASITLKVDVGYPRKISKAEADEKLKRRLRKYTLGNAIKEAAEKKLYAENVQSALEDFLHERNWFTHRIVDDVYTPAKWGALFVRLKSIANEAHRIQRAIEDDLILFSEANGLNMSNVRAAIRQWDHGYEQG